MQTLVKVLSVSMLLGAAALRGFQAPHNMQGSKSLHIKFQVKTDTRWTFVHSEVKENPNC